MNHLCLLMGHDWGRWCWQSSWMNRYTPGQPPEGAGHIETRECRANGCGWAERREMPGIGDSPYAYAREDEPMRPSERKGRWF